MNPDAREGKAVRASYNTPKIMEKFEGIFFVTVDTITTLIIWNKREKYDNHYFISIQNGRMEHDVPQCKSTTSKNNDLKNHRYNNGMPLNVSYLKKSQHYLSCSFLIPNITYI